MPRPSQRRGAVLGDIATVTLVPRGVTGPPLEVPVPSGGFTLKTSLEAARDYVRRAGAGHLASWALEGLWDALDERDSDTRPGSALRAESDAVLLA